MNESAERDEAIVSRYLAGETMQEIGASLGVSRQRIHQILALFDLTGQDRRAILDRQIAMWHAEDMTTAETVALVGKSREWVLDSLRRQGLRPILPEPPRALTPEQVQEAIRLHQSGMTQTEIGALFGVHVATVSDYLIRAGYRCMTRTPRPGP